MYLYCAALLCDDCGTDEIKRLTAEGLSDTEDSDHWPQWSDECDSETDCPSHCDRGPDCKGAIDVGMPDGRKAGALIRETLTEEGVRYVHEAMVRGWNDVTRLWREEFGVSFEAKDATICLRNSDDDPTQIMADVHAPFAEEWADDTGSCEGGTWEGTGDPGLVYDIWTWHPGLVKDLQGEGYRFDLSEYSDPDERDIAIARHAGDCTECMGDWHRAESHSGA